MYANGPVSHGLGAGIPGDMSRLRFPVAPCAGALALALGVVAVAVERHGASSTAIASAVLAGGAGGLALWHGDRFAALVVADALLAGAVMMSLFGLGAMFVLPLLPMLAATVDTPARGVRPKHHRPSTVATFAAGPVRHLPLRRSA
jgi:hypothetical protein